LNQGSSFVIAGCGKISEKRRKEVEKGAQKERDKREENACVRSLCIVA